MTVPLINNRFFPRVGPASGGPPPEEGPWIEVGGVVQLTDISWDVVIGDTVMVGTERLRVVGDARIEGKLTVTGSIDPTDVQLSGGTALFFGSTDGSTAPVSAAGSGRLRYNQGLTRWEASVNGGAYVPITSAATAPGGANTNVQFNNAGAFGGDASFTYNGAGLVSVGAGLDRTAAGSLAIGGAVATSIVVGSALTTITENIADNNATAFRMLEGANSYLTVSTVNAAEAMSYGNTTTSHAFNMRDNAAAMYRVQEGANVYVDISTANGAETIVHGNALTRQTFNIADNVASVFQVLEGANVYLGITTTNAAERITLGSTLTRYTINVADNVDIVLSSSQRAKIAHVQAETISIERRIAQLDLEQEAMRALWRQKKTQLQTVCSNALREHGIDLDDPEAGRWRINPETMEVQCVPELNQGMLGPQV